MSLLARWKKHQTFVIGVVILSTAPPTSSKTAPAWLDVEADALGASEGFRLVGGGAALVPTRASCHLRKRNISPPPPIFASWSLARFINKEEDERLK